MVLQQGKPVTIWGTADDGEAVTVSFAGQEKKATAKDGRWQVVLDPLTASATPATLTVAGPANTVTYGDVLVGEVWLASGQSNMQWSVKGSKDPEATIAGATDPLIRLITVPRKGAAEPQADIDASWVVLSPETVGDFSAVAYFFGRDLRAALNVPVGLVSTNYGGTPAEAWTNRPDLEAVPALESYLKITNRKDSNPAHLYNAMIAPLVPLAVRGAIWYQGESNAGQPELYRTLFPTMITSWRKAFGQGDFPFLFVQLAPFMKKTADPVQEGWAALREAQLMTLTASPSTGMAVITDVGEEDDIHPKAKQPVGARLALAALKIAYGRNIVHSGPIFKNLSIDGDKAVLHFDHVGGGLVAKDGPLTGFAIAGPDGKFVKADATIAGDTVVVTSPEVKAPKAVRYGWANFPVVNLWNKDGLPASPFRTDTP
jgi:sialate O-acetylesterase